MQLQLNTQPQAASSCVRVSVYPCCVVLNTALSQRQIHNAIIQAAAPTSSNHLDGRSVIASSCLYSHRSIRRRNVRCYASGRLPMSAAVIEIVSQAKQQAARQGILFVGLDQLVLGLLGAPCHTAHVLETTGAGLTLEQAVTMIDSQIVVPVNSPLRVGDVDLSPAAKEALTYAQECALEQGSKVICSSHLGVVLLQDLRSPLRDMLEARGISLRSVEDEVLSSYDKYPEEAGNVMSTQQQIERLKLEYERMKSGDQDGGFRSSYEVPPQQSQKDDYDDIYN